jgi:hypothetical protein
MAERKEQSREECMLLADPDYVAVQQAFLDYKVKVMTVLN